MRKWLLGHRKIMTFLIIIFSLLLMIVNSLVFKNYIKTKFEFVEVLYYCSQIISAIFVISGVVIAIWQYYLSCLDSKRNIDVICVQKAIDLSEYYKDNILLYTPSIRYIFENSGISDILSKIEVRRIEHFDQKELNNFLNEKDIQTLQEIQKSDKFISAIINANSIYNLGLNEELITSFKNKKDDNISLSELDQKMLSVCLGRIITIVLNNLEYFSLHFTHRVADESVIYKSLHQTYISVVQMLYYHIAMKNPLSTTKYFTNIIELYEIWHDRAINDEKSFTNDIRNLSNKGTVVNLDK